MHVAFRDIQEFAAVLEKRGWLRRILARVSPVLEITEIADRCLKAPGGAPALLFENVEGSAFPVLINVFGTMERMCLALGVSRLEELGDEIRDLMKMPVPGGGLLDKLGTGLKLLEVAKNAAPKVLSRGPCQEVVEERPDLTRLPVLKCWPDDAGRFITLPLVMTRDPETGVRNLGMYRLQVYDAQTTGMHWHLHKDASRHAMTAVNRSDLGKRRLEAAVVIGADPATIYAACAPLPPVIPELLFAGVLRKAPVELVHCKTVDLDVPAHAEFVLEGYVDLDETRVEGPFGDHTGFYSPADPYPVFHVTCVTRKKNPVYVTTIVGKPPMEDLYLGKATERIFLPMMQMILPEIIDVNMPAEGTFHNCILVRIKKRYPGHARKVAGGLWGLGLMMLTKLIVVVDEDCDVQDVPGAVWRILANVDPRRDVFFADGPLDDLDHSSPTWRIGSKMGVDATRKWPEEGHPRPWPDEIEMSTAVQDLVSQRWREYGFAK